MRCGCVALKLTLHICFYYALPQVDASAPGGYAPLVALSRRYISYVLALSSASLQSLNPCIQSTLGYQSANPTPLVFQSTHPITRVVRRALGHTQGLGERSSLRTQRSQCCAIAGCVRHVIVLTSWKNDAACVCVGVACLPGHS